MSYNLARPTTSGNLVRTNSQDFNQFVPRPGTLNSQIRFAQSNNVVAFSPGPQQNVQQFVPRPVFQQNVPQFIPVAPQYSQVVPQAPQVVYQVPQNVQQSQQSATQFNTISQPQNTILTNATPVISQTSIPTPNQQTRAIPL